MAAHLFWRAASFLNFSKIYLKHTYYDDSLHTVIAIQLIQQIKKKNINSFGD